MENYFLFNNLNKFIFVFNLHKSIHLFNPLKLLNSYNNVFLVYKTVVISREKDFFLYKKVTNISFKKFNNFFVMFSTFFLKSEYTKFMNFFYLLFFNKLSFIFFTLAPEFFEFVELMRYVYDYKVLFLFRKLFKFKYTRANRVKFIKILSYIYSAYKISVTVMFDARVSSYYENFIYKTNTLVVGFEHGFHRVQKYSYSIFVAYDDFALKFLLFNQICDLYFFALLNFNFFICKRYFTIYKLLLPIY